MKTKTFKDRILSFYNWLKKRWYIKGGFQAEENLI